MIQYEKIDKMNMSNNKEIKKDTKTLHPRNLHNNRYDFDALIKSLPELKEYVTLNKYDDLSIDFANPKAVLCLNKSLLAHFYKIKNWEIPENYLCPPIPGRADYIHYIADVLSKSNNGKIPKGNKVTGLDIGVGANCIYPIIGNSSYGWNFIGSDIDEVSINSAQSIIKNNKSLENSVKCKLQTNSSSIFTGIVDADEKFDFVVCNPPFHKSLKDATAGSNRKITNLTKKESIKPTLNFGGQSNELWYPGGEVSFIKRMIKQSTSISKNCFWFSTLVSKKENLPEIYGALKTAAPVTVKTIEMKQGQKISRIVVWTFLSKDEQKIWRDNRWK